MVGRRQTHLGSTRSKTLAIIDFVPPSLLGCNESCGADEGTAARCQTLQGTPTAKPLLFQLPDELLVLIVELAASGSGVRSQMHHATACDKNVLLILSQVCRRLKRIAQPLLFRNIRVEGLKRMVPPSSPVIKLHRTLKDREDLRQHCRSLHIYIPDIGRSAVDSYLVANDFAEWLTGTRSLSIHGGFESHSVSDKEAGMGNECTWRLLGRMATNFENLEQMDICREGWGLYLPPIFKWLACPKLKRLNIHGISESKLGAMELELEKRRTATFTSLSISDYEERPEATFLLIQWPAVLTHFEFGSFYNNRHIMDYPLFESWLLVHRYSLTHIDIGYLSQRGSNRLFNATLFPVLEYLRLSRWQMQVPLAFSPEDANVLGPSVKAFTWDFSIYDQHSENWCDFGDCEATWVRELAQLAIARKVALAKVEIQFRPDFWGQTEETGYPWDRMDSVRDQVFKPNGLDLVYSKPTISKDAWLKLLTTGEGERDANEEVIDDAADNQQVSVADEQHNTDTFACETQQSYQGEDIRGYLVGKLKGL